MAERKKPPKAKAKARARTKAKGKKGQGTRTRARKASPTPNAKDTAAVKAAAAKDEKSRGQKPGISDAERQTRDLEIFRGALRGMDPPTLAATYELTTESIQAIIAKQREHVSFLRGMTPQGFVDWYLMRMDALIAVVANEAARNQSPTSRSSVIRTQADLMERQLKTLQTIGVLPEDLGRMRAYLDAVGLAKRLDDLLERYDMPEPMRRELDDILPTIDGTAWEVTAPEDRQLEPAA